MPSVLRISAAEVGGVVVSPEYITNPAPNWWALGEVMLQGRNPTLLRPNSSEDITPPYFKPENDNRDRYWLTTPASTTPQLSVDVATVHIFPYDAAAPSQAASKNLEMPEHPTATFQIGEGHSNHFLLDTPAKDGKHIVAHELILLVANEPELTPGVIMGYLLRRMRRRVAGTNSP